MEVLRIGRGPTPMLYYTATTLETDGAIMVTGCHNPPDYNGFKMMLGGKPFFGAADPADRRMAARRRRGAGGRRQRRRPSTIADDYVARLLADWDGGDRMLKVVWDNGNGAAGDVLEKLVASLPGEHLVLNGTIDGTLPRPPPRPDRARRTWSS